VKSKPRASKRGYTLSGLLSCGLCDRRMVGSFNNNRQPLPMPLRAEYADTNSIAHPRSLYVREDKIIEQVDPWISRAFRPANLQATLRAIADAQHNDADQQLHRRRPREACHHPDQA
jgi:hypothetical protein